MVKGIPPGFISIKDAAEKSKGVMDYCFFEDYISLVDTDGDIVGGAMVNDKSFIVQYQGEYYVNEKKYMESMEIAKISPEQRRKKYSLEDAIEMRGIGEDIYTMNIVLFDSKKKDDTTTYTIKYNITSNHEISDSADKRRTPYINIMEADDGVIYTDLNYIDIETTNTNTETVLISIDITRNAKLETITFISPDFPWLDYIIYVDLNVL